MSEQITAYSQYVLPKQWITSVAGRVASWKGGARTQRIIRRFIDRYQVDMQEAAHSDPAAYATFNEFFTRPLRAEARSIAASPFVSPVDGAISQLGTIDGEHLVQAKGHNYTVKALLGGDSAEAKPYHHGQFATIYLSPRDYHRIHMPCDGVLKSMVYVPGDLFSVNPLTARNIPGLFARNERVVCFFEGATGPFVLVLVGATIVGSMATVWHGTVNPPRSKVIRRWDYAAGTIHLKKGQEMGRFMLGSTVVLLFPADPALRFAEDWKPGRAVRLGEPMADLVSAP